jgi:Zn-dependent metalloprotease
LSATFLGGFVLAAYPPADDNARSLSEDIAKQIAQQYLAQHQIDDVQFRNLFLDGLAQAHLRFDQVHAGIPVLAGQIIVHVDLNGLETLGATDARKPAGAIATQPSLDASAAVRRVRKAAGVGGRLTAVTELQIYVSEDGPHLIWHVNLLGLDRRQLPVDWIGLVDAETGALLLSYDNLHTKRTDPPPLPTEGEAVTGVAFTLYLGAVELPTEMYTDGSFGMRDPTRGNNYTTDMLDKRTGDGELFIDADNLWGDEGDTDRAIAGADAHYASALTWDYYQEIHGRTGVFDDGKGVLSRVHFGRDYVNAYWSDACQCVTYGDGDGELASPLVAIDIVAHELTHGVTSATAALIYSGESGGLNESMSDIFATSAEFYADNASDVPDYWLGEQVWTPEIPGDALRYMDHPSLDGRSIDHYSQYTRGMDVHLSSGLANNVFYLLSEGGTNDTSGQSVPAIGREQAEQIFYRALAAYMTPDTDFAAAKEATVEAALDLYDGAVAEIVAAAWAACGVE